MPHIRSDAAERDLLGAVLNAPVEAAEQAAGTLEDAGGSLYLAELFDATPSGAGVAFYAGVVRENALRRRLADEGRRLTQLAEEADRPAAELLADVRERLAALACPAD